MVNSWIKMNKRNIICMVLAVVMSLLCASCFSDRDAKEVFGRVESVMDEHPDSALVLLDNVKTHKDAWSKVQRMRFELLYAKAQNKAYVDFTTDSVMKEVVEYYDDHGTPNEQMEANYLLGCTYRDMGESPMALSCYLDATEKADTLSEDCDYGVLMSIWGQISDEYNRQAMPYKELEANHRFQKYALLAKDTFNYIVGIENDKRAYWHMKDTLNFINTALLASKLFYKKGYFNDAAIAIPSIIPTYIKQHKLEEADSLMRYYEHESGLFDDSMNIMQGHEIYYNTKGLYYLNIGNLDSSEYYYRKLLKYNYELEGYEGLSTIYNLRANTDSLCKYINLGKEAFVDKYSHLHTQAMFNAEGMFNYSRNQRIALEQEKEAYLTRVQIFIIAIACLCLMTIGLVLFIRYKKRKLREWQSIYNKNIETKRELQNAIEDYALMEKDFEAYKIMKAKEIETLHESNERAANVYELAHRKDILSALCTDTLILEIMKNEKIEHNHHSVITSRQWDEVYALLMKELPLLYNTCINNQQLSERERKTLVLTCLGLSTKRISILLNTVPSNISNIKSCINHKLFSDSSAKTLYDNIIFADAQSASNA